MNNNLYSLIALIVAVFMTGMYLRGESARKAEIREELDLIQEQQDLIMNTVASIREQSQLKDSLLAVQVNQANNYVLNLDRERNMSATQLQARGEEIEALHAGLDQLLTPLASSEGFQTSTAPNDSVRADN